jgi:cupin superfamily acireductone dioxygenase involved in methionine salvage
MQGDYISLPAAAKHFFGLKEGQALMDFHKEWKALTEQDKRDIKEGLQKEGYNIE